MESNAYRILDTIRGEADVRALPREEIPALCGELRDFLVENVTKTGGHLASNLGVVELTVALHRVFDLPHDRVIFDVGHQSYVHKILSDRKDRFSTLRRGGGISGFEKLGESPFDAFGTGHASTSVSAALGYAEADRICGNDNYTVAVLGDGAFTGGMVHEALNNCRPDLRLIVVLNENEMSISRNTGALARHIAKMRSSGGYFRFKRGTKSFLSRVPLIGAPLLRGARRLKHAAKGALYGTSYFEGLGLKYLGPVDGNDYDAVENLLEEAKRRQCSVVLHLRTVKGKGYAPAEENPSAYHMVGSAYANNFSEHSLIVFFSCPSPRLFKIRFELVEVGCEGGGCCRDVGGGQREICVPELPDWHVEFTFNDSMRREFWRSIKIGKPNWATVIFDVLLTCIQNRFARPVV